jgi:hypothetical protein
MGITMLSVGLIVHPIFSFFVSYLNIFFTFPSLVAQPTRIECLTNHAQPMDNRRLKKLGL